MYESFVFVLRSDNLYLSSKRVITEGKSFNKLLAISGVNLVSRKEYRSTWNAVVENPLFNDFLYANTLCGTILTDCLMLDFGTIKFDI